MRKFLNIMDAVCGGYSTEESEKLIDQVQGEYTLESIVKDKTILDEILQQAADIRTIRN